jgi:hypothetical protein
VAIIIEVFATLSFPDQLKLYSQATTQNQRLSPYAPKAEQPRLNQLKDIFVCCQIH